MKEGVGRLEHRGGSKKRKNRTCVGDGANQVLGWEEGMTAMRETRNLKGLVKQ